MEKEIINHRWQCICGQWIGEDFDVCPSCQLEEKIQTIKKSKENYNEEDYRDFIKYTCVACDKPIHRQSWKQYKIHGNYCAECCALADKIQKTKVRLEGYRKKLELFIGDEVFVIVKKRVKKKIVEIKIFRSDVMYKFKEYSILLETLIGKCKYYTDINLEGFLAD